MGGAVMVGRGGDGGCGEGMGDESAAALVKM